MSSTTNYDGLFKQVYASSIEDLIPETSLLTKAIKFRAADKQLLGNMYNQPVVLVPEQGFTYSRPDNGAFSLNPASSMQMKNALVGAYQLLSQSTISYEAFARSDNANSFKNATSLVMENVMRSFHARLEIGWLYGKAATGIGRTTNTSTNVSATSTTFAFETGQWAGGMWSVLQSARLDVYDDSGTWLNTTAPIVVSTTSQTNKTVTVTGNAADITTIDTYLDGSTVGRYVTIRFATGGTGSADEAAGLDAIFTNTGTLFDIDAAQYPLWKANTYDANGALDLEKIQKAIALAYERGLDEDVNLYVNAKVWEDISTEQVALRMFDSSYSPKQLVNGTEALVFHSQNGKINIFAHRYVKEGDAFMFPPDVALRVGSTDVTFNIPGTMNGQVFIQSTSNAGYTFRLYSGQSLFVYAPAKCTKIYGITVS